MCVSGDVELIKLKLLSICSAEHSITSRTQQVRHNSVVITCFEIGMRIRLNCSTYAALNGTE